MKMTNATEVYSRQEAFTINSNNVQVPQLKYSNH